MNKEKFLVYFLLLLSMLFWGLSYIWTKIVLTAYKPITIIFLRLIISSIMLWLLGKLFRKIQKVQPSEVKFLFLIAFFEPFIYFLSENFGLNYVSSTTASVIIATIPIVTPFIAYLVANEKLTWTNYAGIFLSFIGVFFIIIKNDFTLTASPLGIALLFVAVFSAAGYTILISKHARKYSIYTLITWQNTIGSFYFLPLFLLFDFSHFAETRPDLRVIGALLQLSVLASTLSFLFFTYGLKKIGLSKANTFTNLIPFFTAFFAWFLLNEKLLIINYLGMMLVIIGLVISQFKPAIISGKA